jgi:hypothetical protein
MSMGAGLIVLGLVVASRRRGAAVAVPAEE